MERTDKVKLMYATPKIIKEVQSQIAQQKDRRKEIEAELKKIISHPGKAKGTYYDRQCTVKENSRFLDKNKIKIKTLFRETFFS